MAETLQDFVKTTTMHGPAEIYNAKTSFGRFYWSAIFVAMVAVGIYFIYMVVASYLEAPIATMVTAVDPEYMILPEVAICYTGAINAAKLLDSGLSKEAVRALDRTFQLELGYNVRRHVREATRINAINLFKVAKPEMLNFMAQQKLTGYDDLLQYANYNCTQLIHEFHQPFNKASFNYSCDSLRIVPHELFGTCYVLPAIRQSEPSILFGWSIFLKAPLEHALLEDLQYARSFALEFAVKYYTQTLDFYKLPLNRSVAVALQRTTYNRLKYRDWPRSYEARCFNNDNDTPVMKCFTMCYAQAKAKACKCLPLAMGKTDFGETFDASLKNYPICWPDVQYSCSNVTIINECLHNCLPLCNETTYGVTVTYADFGAELAIRELGLASSVDGVIDLRIGYNTMRSTNIVEQDTSGLDGCISNIGGMFGLWLGGSIFTIIHVLTWLCDFCCHKTQNTVKLRVMKSTYGKQHGKNDNKGHHGTIAEPTNKTEHVKHMLAVARLAMPVPSNKSNLSKQ